MGTSGTPLQYVIVDRLDAFLNQIYLTTMYRSVREYHSDLSDQSALEIRVRIRVRLKSCTILAFFTESNENEHLIFRYFHRR